MWIMMSERQPAERQLVIFYDAAMDWFAIGDLRQDGHFHQALMDLTAGVIGQKEKPSTPASHVTHWQSLEGLAFTPDIATRDDRRTEVMTEYMRKGGQIPPIQIMPPLTFYSRVGQ